MLSPHGACASAKIAFAHAGGACGRARLSSACEFALQSGRLCPVPRDVAARLPSAFSSYWTCTNPPTWVTLSLMHAARGGWPAPASRICFFKTGHWSLRWCERYEFRPISSSQFQCQPFNGETHKIYIITFYNIVNIRKMASGHTKVDTLLKRTVCPARSPAGLLSADRCGRRSPPFRERVSHRNDAWYGVSLLGWR